jgi:uncharacterized tellurite resistance protein B-like protein
MERIELFANLVALAASDGKFMAQEIEYLARKAELWGLDPDDVDSVLIGIQEAAQEVTVPSTRSERVELLSEMIRMMASDGELAESEKRICATVSAAMDFTSQEFNEILDQLLEG